ncbi:hypothetical protein OE766_07945 [Pararhizobium sp. YC-54]|uniref:hypothetical protein n=1 Tax=Pararhizobium sp. YC-54 TaxID=2986920 RepID=UPI0021F7957C|nr:hypothetical protein [Pararhizobium sp. YC-54]MCV9998174.1 hypothetical protein [Pararhizobium sp. YC-54]
MSKVDRKIAPTERMSFRTGRSIGRTEDIPWKLLTFGQPRPFRRELTVRAQFFPELHFP